MPRQGVDLLPTLRKSVDLPPKDYGKDFGYLGAKPPPPVIVMNQDEHGNDVVEEEASSSGKVMQTMSIVEGEIATRVQEINHITKTVESLCHDFSIATNAEKERDIIMQVTSNMEYGKNLCTTIKEMLGEMESLQAANTDNKNKKGNKKNNKSFANPYRGFTKNEEHYCTRIIAVNSVAFHKAMKAMLAAQNTFESHNQMRLKGQIQTLFPDANDEDLEDMVRKEPEQIRNLIMEKTKAVSQGEDGKTDEQLQVDLNALQDEHDALEELEKAIVEVNEMFLYLETLVDEQTKKLASIEDLVDATDTNIKDAVQRLKEAEELQEDYIKNRNLVKSIFAGSFCLLIVAIIVIAVIVLEPTLHITGKIGECFGCVVGKVKSESELGIASKEALKRVESGDHNEMKNMSKKEGGEEGEAEKRKEEEIKTKEKRDVELAKAKEEREKKDKKARKKKEAKARKAKERAEKSKQNSEEGSSAESDNEDTGKEATELGKESTGHSIHKKYKSSKKTSKHAKTPKPGSIVKQDDDDDEDIDSSDWFENTTVKEKKNYKPLHERQAERAVVVGPTVGNAEPQAAFVAPKAGPLPVQPIIQPMMPQLVAQPAYGQVGQPQVGVVAQPGTIPPQAGYGQVMAPQQTVNQQLVPQQAVIAPQQQPVGVPPVGVPEQANGSGNGFLQTPRNLQTPGNLRGSTANGKAGTSTSSISFLANGWHSDVSSTANSFLGEASSFLAKWRQRTFT